MRFRSDANRREAPGNDEAPRSAAGVTQAGLADVPGVPQACISKIEHGEISGIDIVRSYVSALGGSVDVVARLGDLIWKLA
jgi:predicted transcriptional regulator